MFATISALLPLFAAPGEGPTTFTDETFDDANWETLSTDAGGIANGSAAQVLAGNPAPARRVTHEFVSGSGLFTIRVRHVMTSAAYDPAVGGPIETLHYSLDTLNIQTQHRLNWALQQGGRFYVESGPTTSSSWTTQVSGSLVPTHFVERLLDGSVISTSHPDFSTSGDPIEFGFETTNGAAAGSVYIVDYDNFRVDVDAVPSAFAVRVGSPPNPEAFLPTTGGGPVVGSTWEVAIDHASFVPDATLDFVGYSLFPDNVPTVVGTFLCADVLSCQSGLPGIPFDIGIPDHLALIGVEVCFQGASCDPLGGLQLTNALDATIGAF